eukprot:1400148-Pleurochrysis_carterae.AAC.3
MRFAVAATVHGTGDPAAEVQSKMSDSMSTSMTAMSLRSVSESAYMVGSQGLAAAHSFLSPPELRAPVALAIGMKLPEAGVSAAIVSHDECSSSTST